MSHIYENLTCLRCFTGPESIQHRYQRCNHVKDAWNTLRELLESIDQLVLFESDHSILNLYFSKLLEEEKVLWLIGEYVHFVDQESVLNRRKISSSDLIGYLEARRLACNFLKIPCIGHIPGIQLL